MKNLHDTNAIVGAEVLARNLAESYSRAGHPCEIEISAKGLIVYAGSRVSAEYVASSFAQTARKIYGEDDKTHAELPAQKDKDEPPETSWWCEVTLDPRRL